MTYDDDGKRTNQLAKINYGIGLEFITDRAGARTHVRKSEPPVSEPTAEAPATNKMEGVGASVPCRCESALPTQLSNCRPGGFP